jgi:hypothetical protein
MSNSIYHSLYKYPSSDERSQLENYLTEAFVNILNRLKKDETVLFLKECLLKYSNNGYTVTEFIKDIENVRNFSWKSQYTIYYEGASKYPDIALWGEELLLLIENKVGAGFTYHQDNEGDVDDSQVQNQLEVYGRWLSAKNPKSGLVLLTHNTNAPDNFLNDNKYQANLRSITSWKSVYKWFRRWSHTGNKEHIRKKLAYEFIVFLEGIGMSDISNKDLSVLDLYLSNRVNEKAGNLMKEARNMAQKIIKNINTKPQKHINYWDDAQLFWDWCYCYEKNLQWYIGWGIRFPEGSNVWNEYEIPSYPQAFIDISSDNIEVPLSEISSEKKKVSWCWISKKDENRCIKAISVSDLVASSSGFTQAFIEWLNNGLTEAVEILEEAHEIYRNK